MLYVYSVCWVKRGHFAFTFLFRCFFLLFASKKNPREGLGIFYPTPHTYIYSFLWEWKTSLYTYTYQNMIYWIDIPSLDRTTVPISALLFFNLIRNILVCLFCNCFATRSRYYYLTRKTLDLLPFSCRQLNLRSITVYSFWMEG